MAKAGITHDISFSIGGTEYGYMLAKDKDGVLAYNRANLNLLPDAAPTTGASNNDSNPAKSVSRYQGSFSGGVSDTWFQGNGKYYGSSNAEATYDKSICLSPKGYDEYRPTLAALSTWAVTGDTPTYTGTTLATYAAQAGTLSLSAATVTLSLADYITNWSVCVLADVVANGATAIYQVTAGTAISSQTITNATITAAVATIIPGAGTITIDAYANAAAGTVIYSNIRYGTPRAFCQFGGSIYAGVDNVLMGMGTSDTWFKYCTSAVNNIVDIEAWGTFLYVASGATAIKYTTAPTQAWASWVASTVITACYHIGVCGQQMIATTSARQAYAANTIGTDTWVTLPAVGITGTTITNVISHPYYTFIAATDGVYTVNSSTLIEKYLDLSAETNANTGKGAKYWQNALYVPAGRTGLWRVDDDGVAENISNDYGYQYQAFAGDQTWLTAISANDFESTFAIVRGRDESDGFVWHTAISGSSVVSFYDAEIINGATINRLLIASSRGIVSYYHPQNYGYPNSSSTIPLVVRSGGPGYFYTSWHDMGFRDKTKAFYSLNMAGYVPSGGSIVATYSLVGPGNPDTRHVLGTMTATSTSSATVLYFPTSITGKQVRIAFELYRGTGINTTPILYSYEVFGQLTASPLSGWDVGVEIAPNGHLRNGGMENVDVNTAAAAINTGVNSDWPVTYYDLDGSTHYVVMRLTGDRVISDPQYAQYTRYITLNLQEIEWSP